MFKTAQDGTVGKYAYQRYPLVMHRGEHPNIESRYAQSEADENTAMAAGWSTIRPAVPEPEPEPPVLTLEQRVAALEDAVAELNAPAQESFGVPKRGPGRPRKGLSGE